MKEIKRIETKKGERFYSYSRLQFRWFPIKKNEVEELKEVKKCIIYDADERTIIFDGRIQEEVKEEIHIEEVKPVVNNVIDLNSLRKQKQNKSVKLCVCGSILKTDEDYEMKMVIVQASKFYDKFAEITNTSEWEFESYFVSSKYLDTYTYNTMNLIVNINGRNQRFIIDCV